MSEEQPGYKVAADGHIYHKSATANASVAPTNDHTLKNADDVEGLTPEQADFVTVCQYEYALHSQLPSLEFLEEEYGYTHDEAKELFKSPAVIRKLNDRGITLNGKQFEEVGVFERDTVKKPKAKLSAIQLMVANTMLDLTDTKSEKKKLQDLGVSSKQYNMWLRDPEFSGYLRERAEALIGDLQHEAMLSLADNVRSGKMDAIKYYHELTGRFIPSAASGNGTGTVHDLQNIIIRITEIIIDEVSNPQEAARIADRLKALVIGNQVAGVIPVQAEVIEQPEIAPARELTPQVKAMMDKGLGVNT